MNVVPTDKLVESRVSIEPNRERSLVCFSKAGALFALGLWGERLRSACSHRFELGDDHYAWDGLLDYINDYSFFGGFGRLSRRLGRLRTLGGRLPCAWFDSQLLGLCLYGDAVRCFLGCRLRPGPLGCLSGSGVDFCAGLSAFRNRPLSGQCSLFSLSHNRLPLALSANLSASENRCAHPQASKVYTNSGLWFRLRCFHQGNRVGKFLTRRPSVVVRKRIDSTSVEAHEWGMGWFEGLEDPRTGNARGKTGCDRPDRER
jgi:hypothetical protein